MPSIPPARILITGATGFLGQHLVAALLAQKHQLTLLVREAYSAGKPLPPRLQQQRIQFDVAYADLRNFQLTARAIRQATPDYVLHLAAAGATDPFLPVNEAVRHNVTGTLNLIRACFEKPAGIKRLILCRTPGELTAMNVYAASKAAAWSFCQMYARTQQWPLIGAMIFQAYGTGQSDHALIPAAFAAAKEGRDFPMTAGSQQRDWIHVDDIVGGLLTLLATTTLPAGLSVDLGTGQMATVADIVSTIYRIVDGGGRPLPGRLASRPGEAPQQCANLQLTKTHIDWTPQLLLADGLAKTWQALQSD